MKEIDLFITEKCNLKCRFCSINAGEQSNRELDYETVKKFVHYCRNHGVTDIHVTGGEPTLHREYKKIIALINENNIDSRLITNGVNLTKSDLEDLRDIGLHKIMISLDGMNNFHNSVRGNGKYKKTLDTIKEALALGFYVRVNTVAWNENLEDVFHMMNFLNTIGVSTYSVFLGSPVGRGKVMEGLSYVKGKRWIQFIKKLQQFYTDNNIQMKVIMEQGYSHHNTEKVDYSKVRSCTEILSNTDYLTVRADGNIYPCIFFDNEFQSIGNIHDLEDLDIESNLQNNPFYKGVSKIPNECNGCSNRTYCNGGCRELHSISSEIFKDMRCIQDDYYPICPLIKMDLLSEEVAPCTDDLDIQ